MERYAGQPFVLIGVNSDADRDEARQIAQREGLAWRSFWNGEEGPRGPIASAWGVFTWPTLYVIDGSGTVRFHSVGSPGEDVLEGWIEELLAEDGDEV